MEKIEICNNALIEAHQGSTIVHVDEKSPNAERCRRIYDSTRREVLSMFPWSFANKIIPLARVKEDVDGYLFAYRYPAEALRINDVYPSEKAFKARRAIQFSKADVRVAILDGVKCILCNYEEPFVSENIDVLEETLFPPLFCRLLYLEMALKITKMAGTDADVRTEILRDIQLQMSLAATETCREVSVPEEEVNYYVDVRA